LAKGLPVGGDTTALLPDMFKLCCNKNNEILIQLNYVFMEFLTISSDREDSTLEIPDELNIERSDSVCDVL
jgi:hypothetical protein